MKKMAVVVFNLGGPDRPEAIRPFLTNLFNDPAIISLPAFMRKPLAWFIAKKRTPVATEIYSHLGGKSPLLEQTEGQTEALEKALSALADEVRVFIGMRYWHPFIEEAAKDVAAFAPEQVVLLPLYPQYSTTTSGSSFKAWDAVAKKIGITAKTKRVCCYPTDENWIEAQASLLQDAIKDVETTLGKNTPYRVLFSAHGLPKKVIEAGDPYQWQVEETAKAVVKALYHPKLDWQVCYQSRVGPLEWIGPSTEDEITRAGNDGKAIVLVPIAFVSEHSETLVELDIEYAELAHEKGVPAYQRVPTVQSQPRFIEGLAKLVKQAITHESSCASHTGFRVCSLDHSTCPNKTATHQEI